MQRHMLKVVALQVRQRWTARRKAALAHPDQDLQAVS
jgi:hypothetical protein